MIIRSSQLRRSKKLEWQNIKSLAMNARWKTKKSEIANSRFCVNYTPHKKDIFRRINYEYKSIELLLLSFGCQMMPKDEDDLFFLTYIKFVDRDSDKFEINVGLISIIEKREATQRCECYDNAITCCVLLERWAFIYFYNV